MNGEAGGPEPPATESGTTPTSLSIALARILLVFTRPAIAFRGLDRDRFTWLVPAVIVALLMILPAQTVLRPLYIEQQQEAITDFVDAGFLSEEQAHDALQKVQEQAEDRRLGRTIWQFLLGLGYHIVLRYMLPAALLFAGAAFVMQARSRYVSVLAAVTYSSLPAGLREILRTPLRMAEGSLEVFFSPAILTGRDNLGGFILDLFDVFELWILALLVVGLSTVVGISRGRAAALVIPLWVVYSLLKIAIKASPIGTAL